MPDAMSITDDAGQLLSAIARVGAKAAEYLDAASLETAQRVADEMRRRIARSEGPWKSPDSPTWQKIHHEKARSGGGYVVMAFEPGGRLTGPVDLWLERGTRFMPAQPFLWASAQVEEGAHRRRMEEAVMRAVDEVGV
jgi:hypothetical protein